MKKKTHVLLVLVIIMGTSLGALPTGLAQEDDITTLAANNNAFAFDFYGQIADGSAENLIFSPISISQAFGMLMAAARGNTGDQMAATMHYTLPQDALHPAFAALNANLIASEEESDKGSSSFSEEGQHLQLNIANAIWAQEDFPFHEAYLTLIGDYYDGGLFLVDFVRAAEVVREAINDWIEEKTEDKIQDMLPQGSLDAATRMVLVNAIYFNGSWLNPFEESATQDDTFTLLDDSTVNVPMMFQQESMGYLSGDGFQAVELPYFGNDVAMLIVLPEAGQYEAVQAQLDSAMFDDIRKTLTREEVQLFMPRFAFETAVDLKTILRQLGMTDVFDGSRADLTGMFDPAAVNGNLFVSAALHKAYIGVDEAGTEAAAATAIMVSITSAQMPTEPVEVRLDHPFIYAIYDRQTGAILFLGQVLNPAA